MISSVLSVCKKIININLIKIIFLYYLRMLSFREFLSKTNKYLYKKENITATWLWANKPSLFFFSSPNNFSWWLLINTLHEPCYVWCSLHISLCSFFAIALSSPSKYQTVSAYLLQNIQNVKERVEVYNFYMMIAAINLYVWQRYAAAIIKVQLHGSSIAKNILVSVLIAVVQWLLTYLTWSIDSWIFEYKKQRKVCTQSLTVFCKQVALHGDYVCLTRKTVVY